MLQSQGNQKSARSGRPEPPRQGALAPRPGSPRTGLRSWGGLPPSPPKVTIPTSTTPPSRQTASNPRTWQIAPTPSRSQQRAYTKCAEIAPISLIMHHIPVFICTVIWPTPPEQGVRISAPPSPPKVTTPFRHPANTRRTQTVQFLPLIT